MKEDLLSWMEPELRAAVEREGRLVELGAGEALLRPGAYVAGAPLVIEGLVKVDQVEEDRELLLYYLHPGESCVMSFQAALQGRPSQVAAYTEQPTRFYLLPAERLREWNHRYPSLQRYFLDLYHQRYEGLIEMINQLAFQRLDARILAHLAEKAEATGSRIFHMTHQQLAQEVGSTREVVSRALKKLEREGKLSLGRNEIKFFASV
jgi:CRP/FNR family transcriptional regulator